MPLLLIIRIFSGCSWKKKGVEISMDNKVDLKTIWMEKFPGRCRSFSGRRFAGRGSSYLKFFFLLGRYTYRHLCALSGNTDEGQAVSAAVQAFKTQVGIGYAYMAGRGVLRLPGCVRLKESPAFPVEYRPHHPRLQIQYHFLRASL